MKERPILFSGPMVLALLAGRKTQTRRVVRRDFQWLPHLDKITRLEGIEPFAIMTNDGTGLPLMVPCPYGYPGDRLWVRETFDSPPGSEDRSEVLYRADVTPEQDRQHAENCRRSPALFGPGKWRPSIFMPRWASRITLEVTSVRVERLQDISDDDVRAEGVPEHHEFCNDARGCSTEYACDLLQDRFAALWDKINGKRANWSSNPWLWVVTFKRVTGG